MPYGIKGSAISKEEKLRRLREWYKTPAGRACKARANEKALAKYHAEDKTPHAERARRNYYRTKYGITADQAEAIKVSQGCVCPVCGGALGAFGRKQDDSVLDHCHATGKVRGVLHWRCNVALGFLKDNPEALRAGAAYVEAHRTAP